MLMGALIGAGESPVDPDAVQHRQGLVGVAELAMRSGQRVGRDDAARPVADFGQDLDRTGAVLHRGEVAAPSKDAADEAVRPAGRPEVTDGSGPGEGLPVLREPTCSPAVDHDACTGCRACRVPANPPTVACWVDGVAPSLDDRCVTRS
jgi:hypothetical protein